MEQFFCGGGKAMILVTVGSAPHPFPRLVRAADELAAISGKEVVIQCGFTRLDLKHAKGFDFVPYEEMSALYQKAELVISHASAGPILFARKFKKPLILFPRSGDAGEHIDNHQMDFAHALLREKTDFEIVFDGKDIEIAVKKSSGGTGKSFAAEHSGESVRKEIQKHLESLEQRKAVRSRSSVWRKFKELLYYLRIYRFLSSLLNQTFWILRYGYRPKDFWNRWSERYSKEKARGVIGSSHWWLLEKLQKYTGGRVLEAGCGYGRTLQFLNSKAEDAFFLCGADISLSMIEFARKSLPPEMGIRTLCADMNSLPFSDQVFDVVFTRGALMHCPEEALDKVFLELERVSKGEILLVEEAFGSQPAEGVKTFSLNAYTFIHDYESMLLKRGWEIMEKSLVDEGMVVLIQLYCRKMPSLEHLEGSQLD